MPQSALRQIATQSAEPYVRSYNPLNPKFRESVRSALNDLVGGSNIASNQGYGRGRMVDMLTGTVDFAPVLGDAVGMNPFRHSYFYRKSDGMPVANAEQVIQVGPLVLAKKVKTRPVNSPEHRIDTPEGDRYFKHGGSVERVAHNDNRKYL
jgi:hypothetical protein